MPSTAAPREITWATFGRVSAPMGLQHYESQLLAAITALSNDTFTFRAQRFGGLRAQSAVDTRIPTRLLENASAHTAKAIGFWAYRGRRRLVHRFDLRLPPGPGPEVVTVHDLPPMRFPDEGHLAKWSIESVRQARLVVCPSDFAADEVRALLGVTSVVTIPNGVSTDYMDPSPYSEIELRSLGVHQPFIVHAGGASERKNLRALAAAWKFAAPSLPDHELVLVGPSDARRDAAFAGVDRVVKVGYLDPAIVARLMAAASAVVVPSTYEGFGLPALEGMAAGTPVIASTAGALPEVCGEAALLVEPTALAIADGLIAVCDDAGLGRDLVVRGRVHSAQFTWARSARGHLEAYAAAFGTMDNAP